MSQRLCIRLPATELQRSTVLDWALLEDSGEVTLGRDALETIGQRWGGQRGPEVMAVAPAATVSLTTTQIPSRQIRQVKQALPYMVEELIAEPIEQVHLAIPAELPPPGEALPVAVISHRQLIPWLDCLYSEKLRLKALIPETLVLPWRLRAFTLLVRGDELIWRDGPYSGFVLMRSEWPQFLSWLRQQKIPPPAPVVEIYAHQDEPGVPEWADELRSELPWQVEHYAFKESAWSLLAPPLLRGQGHWINILQGGYKVRRDAEAKSGDWRLVAMVALLGTIFYASLLAASSSWFNWRAAQLEAEMVDVYRQVFPDARRVVSPRRQMAAQRITSPDTLLPLLAGVGHLDGEVQVQQLLYRSHQGTLQLDVQADTLDGLDQALHKLTRAGFKAELGRATETASGTRGSLSVGGRTP